MNDALKIIVCIEQHRQIGYQNMKSIQNIPLLPVHINKLYLPRGSGRQSIVQFDTVIQKKVIKQTAQTSHSYKAHSKKILPPYKERKYIFQERTS